MVDASPVPAQIDKDIHDLLNQIRANPKMLLPHLEERVKNFDGKILRRHGKGLDLMT
jgi:hypothetical protein